MNNETNYIKLEDCIHRRVYRLNSRNLSFGVFNGKNGFIGIRTKFNSRFLDTEDHWDTGAPHGTAKPTELLTEEILPDNIQTITHFPTIDQNTNRLVDFDTPVKSGGRGWYFVDTNEPDQNIKPFSPGNKELFNFIESIIKKYETK